MLAPLERTPKGYHRVVKWYDVLIAVILVVLAAVFVPPLVMRPKERGHTWVKCKNQLRMLGLAAIQYSDDLRFLPHVGRLQQLDGGFQDGGSTTTTKSFRALIWAGYFDDPGRFVCVSSGDRFRPIQSDQTKGNMRLWFWGGKHQRGNPALSPFVDGLPDPAVDRATELSYGWTRKGLNRNTRSTVLLAADRAVRITSEFTQTPPPGTGWWGNHDAAWNVLFADASVQWVTPTDTLNKLAPADMLAATGTRSDGFLAVRDQSQRLGAAAQAAAANSPSPSPSPSAQGR
jgi:hypothetical protein